MRTVGSVALALWLAACGKPLKAEGSGAPTGGGVLRSFADLAAIAEHPDAIAKAVAADPASLAWDLFLYVNWPAKPGVRGVPDPSRPLGATPAVWQTWKEVHEIYLAGGVAPGSWDDGGLQGPTTASLTEIDGTVLNDVNGNPITYTVLLNQGTFEYLVSRALYGWTGQAALRKAGAALVAFPTSAMEVKASWKILDPISDKDRMDHYLVAQILIPQDRGAPPLKATVGLTGLHLTSKALPRWIWITFEQIENPVTTEAKPPLLPMDPAVTRVNAAMQTALAGTPYAYYQLMGVQTEDTIVGAPVLLASTQMETKFQRSSSCLTCHALASISTGKRARLPLFTLSAGNLVGTTGAPPTAPFGPGADQYSALDAVWSMREAKQPVSP
jgi:hypothetical protein